MSGSPIVVGLGEALFDRFGDRSVLGGAPVNFAVHAHQLLAHVGGSAAVVSRVGYDRLGDRLEAELHQWGVSTDYVQRDHTFPTGQVHVTVDDGGHPHYLIEEDVAWDHLQFSPGLATLARSCRAICFGTLGQRSFRSRDTIHAFLSEAQDAIRLCDVNLRQQYFDADVLSSSFGLATAAKLSESELPIVSKLLRLSAADDPADTQAWNLLEAFDLSVLAITRGSRGTVIYTLDDRVEQEPARVRIPADADSVGAGDACDAGLVVGLLLGWPLEQVLTLANAMGAYVASRRGATPRLSSELLAMVTSPRKAQIAG